MRRKSIVINLNGIVKKVSLGLAVIFAVSGASYFGLPEYIARKMAAAVFASESENGADNISGFFSLDPKKVLAEKTMYTPQKTTQEKETQTKTETAAPAPVKTDAPAIIEKAPDAVDFSREKPANAVSASNITVSNVPKKQFDIAALLSSPLKFTKTDGYKVLIIHTHTTEAYLPNDRSENQEENIVKVGDKFTEVLNANGIKTLHCKTVHDAPYRLSYKNELASIEKILKENPSIEVVIDVHRDALYNSKNEKIKPAVNINGETAAQVMLVCGTDASGLYHPTWESCFSFALKIENNMNKNYPGLARPVNLRTERFNTHMTNNSVIFEIGSNGNTLSEAVTAAKYAGQAIADVLNGK